MSDKDKINKYKKEIDRWAVVPDYGTDLLETGKDYYRDDLLENESFQKAAIQYYEMRTGKNIKSFDKLTDAHKQEIAEYAYQGISWFNNNIVSTTGIIADVLYNTTDDQKIAFQYLQDMYKGASWSKKDVGNFAVQGVLADPSTWASIFTGGGSKAAATASQKLALKGIQEASEVAITKLFQKQITGKMMRQKAAKKLIKVSTVSGTQALKLSTKQITKVAAARAAARGKVLNRLAWAGGYGALDATIMNTAEQSVRIQDLTGTAFDGKKYNFQYQDGWNGWQSVGATGMGFTAGVGFGAIGHGASKAYKKFTTKYPYDGSSVQSFAKGLRRTTNGSFGGFGFSRGPKKTTSPTPTTSATARGGRALGAKTLPEYSRKRDWFNTYIRYGGDLADMVANPSTIYSRVKQKFKLRIKHFPVDPKPHVEPVIKSIDTKLDDLGLTKGIRELRNRVNAIKETIDTTNSTTKIAEINKELSDFASANKAKMDELKSHLQAVRAEFDKYPILEGKDITGEFTGLMEKHKKATLKYIDDIIDFSDNLKKPDFGHEGLRKSGMPTTGTGIKDAILHDLDPVWRVVDDAYARVEGKWPDETGGKVSRQWKKSLARSIEEGYYDRGKGLPRPDYVGLRNQENFEHTWQNMLEEWRVRGHDENGKFTGVKWAVSDEDDWAKWMKEMFDEGFAYEAQYIVRMLKYERSSKNINTFPNGFIGKLKGYPEYKTNPKFAHWADEVEKASQLKGVGGAKLGDSDMGGRDVAAYWAKSSYYWRYARRFTGGGFLSTPGKLTPKKRFLYKPRDKLFYYLRGAKGTVALKKSDKEDYFSGIKGDWGDGKTAGTRRLRSFGRSIGRISTLGLFSFNGGIMGAPSTLGWWAIAGAAMWGSSEAIGSFWQNPVTPYTSAIGKETLMGATYYTRELYDVYTPDALAPKGWGDDPEYNFIPCFDKEPTDGETDNAATAPSTTPAPTTSTPAPVVPAPVPNPVTTPTTPTTTPSTTTDTPKQTEKPAVVIPTIEEDTTGNDAFKPDKKPNDDDNNKSKSTGSWWNNSNGNGGKNNNNNSGTGKLTNQFSNVTDGWGDKISQGAQWAKDNALVPFVGLLKNNPVFAGIAGVAAVNWLFWGKSTAGGIFSSLLSGAVKIAALAATFVLVKGAVEGHNQGTLNNVPRMTKNDVGGVKKVNIPNGTISNQDRYGSVPKVHVNDNGLFVPTAEDALSDSNAGDTDGRGVDRLSAVKDNKQSMTTPNNAANPAQDALDAAAAISMVDTDRSSSVNSQGTRAQGGRKAANTFNTKFKNAANNSIYEHSGEGNFLTKDAFEDDSFARVTHMGHEKNGAAVIINLTDNKNDMLGTAPSQDKENTNIAKQTFGISNV